MLVLTFVAAAAIVSLASANTNAVSFPSITSVSSNFVELRVLNRLRSPAGNPATFNQSPSNQIYTGPSSVNAVIVVSGNDVATPNEGAGSDSLTDYQPYVLSDSQLSPGFSVELRAPNGDVLTSCSGQSPVGRRQTLVINEQSENVQLTTESCTTNTLGSCSTNNANSAPSTVTVSCSVVSEAVASARQCDTVNVNVNRLDVNTCALRLERDNTDISALGLAGGETVSSIVSSSDLTLNYDDEYTLTSEGSNVGISADADDGDTTVFEAGDRKVREYDAVVTGDGSFAAQVTEFRSGYVNIINAAHVTFDHDNDNNTPLQNVASVLVVVCEDGACNRVVTTETVSQGQTSGWIELREEGGYTFKVFNGANSFPNVFNNTLRIGQEYASGSLTLDAQEFHMVEIQTVGGSVVEQVNIDFVDVTPNYSEADATARYQVRNLIRSRTVSLAAKDQKCCYALASDFLFATTNTLTTADLTDATDGQTRLSYDMYTNTNDCLNLPDSFGSVTFDAAPSAGGCANHVVYFLGRTVDVESNVCATPSGPSGNPLTCTISSAAQISTSEEVTSSLSYVDDDDDNTGLGNNNVPNLDSVTIVSIELPVCACVASATCRAASTCATDDIDAVAAAIAEVRGDVAAVGFTVNTRFNSRNADAESNKQQILADLDDKFDDIEDLVEDVEEVAEDAEDEAGDASKFSKQALKAAEKAVAQAKTSKSLIRELLEILQPTPPAPPVPAP